MIDASKSPVPAWKRYMTIAVVSVLVALAAYVIYTKEIHKSTANPGPTPAQNAVAPQGAPSRVPTVSTTIPGGVPVSSRNPFQ